MTKIEALLAQRRDSRLAVATAASARVLEELHAKKVDIRLFGSLARGEFRLHSDVDFLVAGPITRDIRATVETTVARVMGEVALPYDVIYLDDLTDAQAAVFARAR